ncbi:MAG: hypothetical protein IH991_14145, partial [Planctomycetes bacterium]|nr:hypothetical protein [Planctomycetota bacterium]
GRASQIPVQNLWYILLYAWGFARFRDRISVAAEESPDLLNLLARVLVQLGRDVLRRGLDRGYVECREPVRGVRGRIDFSASVKRLSLRHGVAHCTFDELDYNVLHTVDDIGRFEFFQRSAQQFPGVLAVDCVGER